MESSITPRALYIAHNVVYEVLAEMAGIATWNIDGKHLLRTVLPSVTEDAYEILYFGVRVQEVLNTNISFSNVPDFQQIKSSTVEEVVRFIAKRLPT